MTAPTAIIRDFNSTPRIDFQPLGQPYSLPGPPPVIPGLVLSQAVNGLPVLNPERPKTPLGIQDENSFAAWFSREHPRESTYVWDVPTWQTGRELTYSNSVFFPIDGAPSAEPGFVSDDDGRQHNFHFTMELHQRFIYEGGESVTFGGDDDIWVFVDDRLLIDLGGIHVRESRTVSLDSLGLVPGSDYRLSLYFAERCTGGSTLNFTGLKVLADCPFFIRQ